jgi:hypothetical protein
MLPVAEAAVDRLAFFVAFEILHFVDETRLVEGAGVGGEVVESVLPDGQREAVNAEFVPGVVHVIDDECPDADFAGGYGVASRAVTSRARVLQRAAAEALHAAVVLYGIEVEVFGDGGAGVADGVEAERIQGVFGGGGAYLEVEVRSAR